MKQTRQTRFGRLKNTGATKSPNYIRWNHMRHRCYLESDPEYFRYGAKGIKIKEEWIVDFHAYDKYIMSLDNALKPTYTIDRIDPLGNYEPGNLRWASKETQSRNCQLSSNNKSGVTGVSWCKQQEQWRATITVERKSISLGRFKKLEDAISARKDGEKKYF